MGKLATLLQSLNKGWLKNMLSGAGLTLGTAGATMIFIDQLITKLRGGISGIPYDVLSLAHIAGFDYGISIILGAIVAAAVRDAGNLSLKKMGNK